MVKKVIVSWWNLLRGNCPRHNHPRKFSWLSVQRFLGERGGISHFFIDLNYCPVVRADVWYSKNPHVYRETAKCCDCPSNWLLLMPVMSSVVFRRIVQYWTQSVATPSSRHWWCAADTLYAGHPTRWHSFLTSPATLSTSLVGSITSLSKYFLRPKVLRKDFLFWSS